MLVNDLIFELSVIEANNLLILLLVFIFHHVQFLQIFFSFHNIYMIRKERKTVLNTKIDYSKITYILTTFVEI